MRQLNYDLKTLLAENPERGHVTRRDRAYILDQTADLLHQLGFRRLRGTGLRRKHVNALVREWNRQRLSVGTLKNRMAALRWWAKGGRAREIPIWNDRQRPVLDAASRLAGGGALIAGARNYGAQRKVYEKETGAAGLKRMHGLRHAYAMDRYENLTGWKAPNAGGPRQRSLTGAMKRIDESARQRIAWELGHDRIFVVSQYIGS